MTENAKLPSQTENARIVERRVFTHTAKIADSHLIMQIEHPAAD
jgi:hypothetical protein